MKGLFKKYFFLPLLFLLSGGPHLATGQASKEAFVDSAVRIHHSVSEDIRKIEQAASTHGTAAVSHTYAGTFNLACFEIIEESVTSNLKFSSAAVVLGYTRQCFRISDFFLPARKLFSDSYLLPVKTLYIFFRVFRL
jgi:hypothetical protein